MSLYNVKQPVHSKEHLSNIVSLRFASTIYGDL
jgi:hypothetical protein